MIGLIRNGCTVCERQLTAILMRDPRENFSATATYPYSYPRFLSIFPKNFLNIPYNVRKFPQIFPLKSQRFSSKTPKLSQTISQIFPKNSYNLPNNILKIYLGNDHVHKISQNDLNSARFK